MDKSFTGDLNQEFELQIGERWYDADGLAELTGNEFTEQEKLALDFCRKWMIGQGTFTVQTSGSTGNPKKISVSRERMKYSAAMTLSALRIEEGSSALLCINAAYIGGIMMLVRAMVGGLKLAVRTPSSTPLSAMEENVTFAAIVPMQLQGILNGPEEDRAVLDRMKAVIVGGAPMDENLEKQTENVTAPVYATFGMTETVSHFALRRINGPGAAPYFTAFEEMELATDERGCLMVKGPVTEEKWVTTNDIIDLQPPGRFRWIGRADNVINSGGVKLHPEKIERKLNTIWVEMGLQEAFFTIGLPDERLGEKLALFIEGKKLTAQILDKLRSEMHRRLDAYEVPRNISFVPEFARTETGKVRRKDTAMALTESR
ncbi:AMP-binding protein [Roseivirga sp. BDSF3-8]|uniref:AMP-binding protein n=1 Tax=Roseivirga sp. BDSF3-8 TaxID=3241598 RepID=UPI0035325DE5